MAKRGHKNTRYFHTLASIKKRKNTITSLYFDDANVVDCADLQEEAVKYFKEIFKEDFQTRPTFEGLDFWKLSANQAAILIEPVSRHEIDEVVASCDSQKAPGMDGFNFKFIKDAWDVIKDYVYAMVKKFRSSNILSKGC